MGRFVGVHTMPGFHPRDVGRNNRAAGPAQRRPVRAGLLELRRRQGVCDWEAASKDAVARAYRALGFPWDEIVAVEAICEQAGAGVDTRYL
jgi:hypothetical protein